MKRKLALCALLLAFVCAACLPFGSQARAEVTVATSFYPVYVLAQNVLAGIEGVRLHNMTAPDTGCLHDYQLLAGDLRTLSQADALAICGAGMEGYLDDVRGQFPELAVIDCSQGVTLLKEEAHDHAAQETQAEHDHAHAYNAHIWLDPQNAMQMVRNLRDGLSALLPEQAQALAANAEGYIARLTALDETLRDGLAGLARRDIVTFHEAFPYFARAYGLNVVAVVALEPDEALSPAQLGALVDAVRAAGNPPLFTEPQYQTPAVRAVAAETGASVYELDPIVTGTGAPDAYETGMLHNLTVLQQALGE